MDSKFIPAQFRHAMVVVALVLACVPLRVRAQTFSVNPAKMPRIGNVDERFFSYNIEMAEVTGGNFWKPYHNHSSAAAHATQPAQSASAPAGMNPNMFQARPPVDLTNPRLRKLAAALGPAYVRVSGTWANTVYFHDSDAPAPAAPPAGFKGVLTRPQWKGVIDFAHAVNAQIVTSFAISAGVRDASGVWTPDQARRLLAFTKSIGGEVAAAEFFNEPTMAEYGGAPAGYDAAAYARDFAVFRSFIETGAPGTHTANPAAVGEDGLVESGKLMGGPVLRTEDLLSATPRAVSDIFSYHFYG